MKRFILLVVVLGILNTTLLRAESLSDLDQRLQSCSLVVKTALDTPDAGIPKDLIRRCRGLAVFPGVVRFGIVLGASFGTGAVVRRDEKTGDWSKPAFFKIKGGSVGFQLGAQYTDLVLLIMSEQGVQHLLEEKFILGADVSVTAGPVGREASAETNVGFQSGILSYSRTQGLFAGVALNGASLEPDFQANLLYHGKGITVQDVFYEGKGSLSEAGRAFIQILDNAVKP